MNIFGIDNTLDLIIFCVTIILILQILLKFFKWFFTREENYVDELVSEERYYREGDEPCFKRLYKRTYSSGKVDYITSED